jgi:hypothetical protein
MAWKLMSRENSESVACNTPDSIKLRNIATYLLVETRRLLLWEKCIFLNLGNGGGFPNLVNARINLYRYLNELNSIENKNTRALNFQSEKLRKFSNSRLID